MINKWTYGVTTCPKRADNLLLQTLESLRQAGFDAPRLFIDGAYEPGAYQHLGLFVTTRYPIVRTAANWVMSIVELYVRNPECTRYAIFQDDILLNKNVKKYLDNCEYPENGYWNLFTHPHYEPSLSQTGWQQSGQNGLGALGLVFDRDTIVKLFTSYRFVTRPQSHRSYRSIDGGIVTAMLEQGCREYIHNPSLVQHVGKLSSMGNTGTGHIVSSTFKGVDSDAMEFLSCQSS